MGGHHSSQRFSSSTSIVTNATMNQTQSCLGIGNGENILEVLGSFNIIENVDQQLSFMIRQDCLNKLLEQNDFQTKIQSSISQQLKSQDVAMTQWLSAGSDNMEGSISNSVKTNITTNLVQTCLAKLSGRNIIYVQGSGNVVDSVVQSQAQSMVQSCMQGSKAANSTIADITNTANQHLEHTEKNPFAFITDAIKAAIQSVAVIAGVVVFAVVALVVLAKMMSHGSKRKEIMFAAAASPGGGLAFQ